MIAQINNVDNYSPKNTIEYENIKEDEIMKNRRKDKNQIIQSSWFVSVKDYDKLTTAKFNVAQLKDLCSFYKVKKTGKKIDLVTRLHSFLKKSNYALKIQNSFRRHLRRIYVDSAGPGLRNRHLCMNDTDFYTMEDTVSIPESQFYSIKDEKGNIFGFDMMSIYQLIQSCRGRNQDKPILNPYTRDMLPLCDVLMVNIRIRLSGVLKIPIVIKPKQDKMDDAKKVEMDCIAIFQIINDLGNYADSNWFEGLDKNEMKRFMRELYDIWNYRAQISEHTKRDIVSPRGNPFDSVITAQPADFNLVKRNAMSVISNLVTKGIDREHCSLGALYVLSALTLVSVPAQLALPWLFHSVM